MVQREIPEENGLARWRVVVVDGRVVDGGICEVRDDCGGTSRIPGGKQAVLVEGRTVDGETEAEEGGHGTTVELCLVALECRLIDRRRDVRIGARAQEAREATADEIGRVVLEEDTRDVDP